MNKLKIAFIFFLVVIVMLQFFNPHLSNKDEYVSIESFKLEENVSADIINLFKTSCFDCHSNQTNYPWYSNIAPISFFVNHHIGEGKEHLNFSIWNSYSKKEKLHKLEEIKEEIEEKEMPLKIYTLLHKSTKLNNNEIKSLLNWINKTELKYSH